MDQTEKSASETPTFGYRHLTNEEYIRQKRESNAAVANFLKETFPSEPYRRRRSGYRRVADAFVLFAIAMLFAAFFLLNNFNFPRFACPVVDAVASTPFAFSHGCASSLVRGLSAAYQRAVSTGDDGSVHELYSLLTNSDDTSERNNILMNAAKFNHRNILSIAADSFPDIITSKNHHSENLAHLIAQSGSVEHFELLKNAVSNSGHVPALLASLRKCHPEGDAVSFVVAHQKMVGWDELLREKASCPLASDARSEANGGVALQKACYIKFPSVREYASTVRMAQAVNTALSE